MQNKGAIQVFAILLTLACIYHLSFTFISSGLDSKAKEISGGDVEIERAYLDSMKNQEAPFFGLFGMTYDDVKRREINLGLDLKGGMNVTLEVSIPELLSAMANKSKDSTFVQALRNAKKLQTGSQRPFVDLFVEEFQKINPQARLASPMIFGHKDQQLINPKMSNEEVKAILVRETEQAINRTFEILNARIDAFGVTQPNIQKLENSGRILVELPGVQDPDRVKNLLEATAKLEFFETYDNGEVLPVLDKINTYLGKVSKTLDKPVVKDSTEVVTDSLSTTTTTTSATLSDSLTQVAKDDSLNDAKKDSSAFANMSQEEFLKENPLFGLLRANVNQADNGQQTVGNGPMVGTAQIKDTAKINSYLRMPQVQAYFLKGLVLAWENKPYPNTDLINLVALRSNRKDLAGDLGGDVIVDASAEPDDQRGGFRVVMKMNNEGAEQWAKMTGKNKGKSIAIVMDGKVFSYPNVEDAIVGGVSTITGSFGADESNALASVLKAGKLPTSPIIVEQAVVGPSLGKEAIRAGLFSLAAAFIIILIYMVFYYGKAGIFADLALLANVFFLIGSLAAFNTTLTLPGITGIVLTIGMAVDANVLIYERIREELRAGKALRKALDDGFKQAFRAIIDSNITTLLIAVILILFGAGPVKGFAVTLFIGILTSMFSAIFITRLIFEAQLKNKREISFSSKLTENAFTKLNFDFVGKRKIFYIISGILVVGSIVSFATKQFNLGVDLQGGRSYTITFDQPVEANQVAEALNGVWGETPIVKNYGSANKVKVVTKYRLDDNTPEVDKLIESEMFTGVKKFYKDSIDVETFRAKTEFGIQESYKVGPTVARDVKFKSLYAVLLSLAMMFVYIMVRFKGWKYGLGALIALIHDVVIVLGLFSLLDGVLPFSLEIDQAIIAAVLTVIGYSINDTVIIFDRIREFIGEGKKGSLVELTNKALNSTIGRTVNTSLTVLFVLLIAFFFGGVAIKGLTFAILVGVLVGTYSSICIATPAVIDLSKNSKEDKLA